jgi:hypothetical protein
LESLARNSEEFFERVVLDVLHRVVKVAKLDGDYFEE